MAINFNGTSQSLQRTANVPQVGAATICGWFRIGHTPTTGDYDCVLSFGDYSSGVSWLAGMNASFGWGVMAYPNGLTNVGTFTTTPSSGQAFFLAMVLRGSGQDEVEGYQRLEGQASFEGLVSDGQGNTINELRVGDSVYDATDYYPGSAWNIKVWDRLLTPGQLLVESFYKRVMFPASLNCHWPLRDSSDLYDYSGNGRNPTAIGSPTSADDSHGLWVPRRKIFLPSQGNPIAAVGWLRA